MAGGAPLNRQWNLGGPSFRAFRRRMEYHESRPCTLPRQCHLLLVPVDDRTERIQENRETNPFRSGIQVTAIGYGHLYLGNRATGVGSTDTRPVERGGRGRPRGITGKLV